MEIEYFIIFIQAQQVVRFTRGQIIDWIAENNDDWIFVLKALLIKNTKKFIHKSYLLEKLEFMKAHPKQPYSFLDCEGAFIFSRLRL